MENFRFGIMLGQIVLLLTLSPLILCDIGSQDGSDDYLHSAIYHQTEDDVIRALNNDYPRGTPEFWSFLESKIINGYTPLISAISSDKINIAKILVKEGANVNAKDKWLETPLHHTARRKDQEDAVLILVRMMLFKGADINAVCDEGLTPLILACQKGHEYIAMEFLIKAAEFNHEDNTSRTALHYAASMGMKSVVDVLLQKGAEIEKGSWKEAPLQCAIRNGHVDIALTLLRAGASADVIDEYSRSLLHYDVVLRNVRLLEELILKGAPINSKTRNDETPLFIAVSFGLEDSVRFLIDADVDINYPNYLGNSPLHVATRDNHEKILKILASHGADLEAKNADEDTALIIAVKNGMVNCVEALLEMGANPNGQVKYSSTPMHSAVLNGASGVIDLLLRHGCDPNVKNIFGNSPLDFALNSSSLKESLALQLIEDGVDVRDENSKQLLKFIPHLKAADKLDIPFDDFVAKLSIRHARMRKSKIPLERLIKRFEKVHNFALYRLLKLLLLQRGVTYVSDLESLKLAIYDELLYEFTKKTYMEKLPLDLVSDAINNVAGGYYALKMDRLAWNTALASRYLDADLEEAKAVAKQLSKNLD